jgi:hypothetical protein
VWASIVVGFLLLNCANQQVFAGEAGKINRVGVASFLGHTFHGQRTGTTAFTNSEYDSDVGDWRIDESTAGYLQAKLAARPFSVEPFNVSTEMAEQLYKHPMNIKPAVSAASQQGYDFVILLLARYDPGSKIFNGNYGLYERSFLGNSHRSMYVEFLIRVFDARTGKQVGVSTGYITSGHPINDVLWREGYGSFSDDEKRAMKELLEENIKRQIDSALTPQLLNKLGT